MTQTTTEVKTIKIIVDFAPDVEAARVETEPEFYCQDCGSTFARDEVGEVHERVEGSFAFCPGVGGAECERVVWGERDNDDGGVDEVIVVGPAWMRETYPEGDVDASVLGDQWQNYCEDVDAKLPTGVTCDDTHQAEFDNDEFWISFNVTPEADAATLLKFFQSIAGAAKPIRIDHQDELELTAKSLLLIRAGIFENYSSPQNDMSRWNTVTEDELVAIQQEIDETANPNATDWSRSGWECDYERVREALEAKRAGATVWVAQDEDGYYFATIL